MLTMLMLWFLPTKAFWNYCWDALPLWRLETPGGAIVNINKSLMLLESAGQVESWGFSPWACTQVGEGLSLIYTGIRGLVT